MSKIQKETTVGAGKVYELSVLFVPELEADALIQTVNSLKEYIASVDGKVISEGEPVYLHLAYTVESRINNKIKRSDYAHFYWVKFEAEAENISKIEKFVKEKMAEVIIRHLIIKTIRENTQLTQLTAANAANIKDEELIDKVIHSEGEESKDAITDVGDLKDSEVMTKEEISAVISEENKSEVI